MSTKSESRIRTVISDHPIDAWNSELLARKLGTLGATVGGLAKGLGEAAEADEKKPFPWGESLVRPQKAAAAGTAPTAKPEFKVVNTRNGVRHVHSFSPSKSFWDARKAGKLPSNVGVGKNQNGDWEATIWGQSPEDTRQTISKLQDMGLLARSKGSKGFVSRDFTGKGLDGSYYINGVRLKFFRQALKNKQF